MKKVATTNAPAAIGPYAQGMIVNNMFYSSGQIPLTAAGEIACFFNRLKFSHCLNSIDGL